MKRLGASVDWSREYFTMDESLSRAVREVFVRLYEEGLIYRGKYIVNWCPALRHGDLRSRSRARRMPGKLYEIRYPVVGQRSEFITVATTRPETMLGDTAVAVNAKDERYTHLHGKKVVLPLMDREIPIILDELADPEFGTGAVKVTPAHDPNDFEAGLRHNLPQIDVIDEHAQHEPERRRRTRAWTASRRASAWSQIWKRKASWSAIKDYTARARQVRALQDGGRAADLDAVVRQDRSRWPKRRSRRWRRATSRSLPKTTRRSI